MKEFKKKKLNKLFISYQIVKNYSTANAIAHTNRDIKHDWMFGNMSLLKINFALVKQLIRQMCDEIVVYDCAEILGASGEAVADLKQLFFLAEKFGYSEWIQFDASVVRGLAYYTGIVFEVRFLLYLSCFYLSV